MAPAYTPLIWLAGIALVGGSWPYALLSLLFVGVHVYHNILAHGLTLRYRMWTMRVVVFYILTFVFTIVLGGIQEAAGLAQTSIILPQWAPGWQGSPCSWSFAKTGSVSPSLIATSRPRATCSPR